MTQEQFELTYPHCIKDGFAYLDANGEPQLKDRSFGESMTYEECVAFGLNYNCSLRRGSIKLEDAEHFLARGRR